MAMAKSIEIESNTTNLDEKTTQSIVSVARSMGVKEPMVVSYQGKDVLVNNKNNKTSCVIKLDNGKIKSFSCR